MSDPDANKDVSARTPTQRVHPRLASAWMPVVELLESRRLFATTTIQTLPFTLDFGADRGELLDKDGQGTGFTRVQANKLGTEYQSGLIDLDTTGGVLKLTTTGTSTAGSNSAGDNTLVNALETQFNATTSGFSVSARLIGPLGFLNNPSEQGGIMFGPDQDNWVKLVAVSQPAGQRIQFIDEQTSSGVYSSALAGSNIANTYTDLGSFAAINTLDLRLVGDAATGKVQAYYAINGGSFVKIAAELTLSGTKKDAFFTSAGRAGLIALHKNDVGPVTVTFDKFEILGGTPIAARPTVTATRPANGATGVSRDSFVAADVHLTTAGAGIDAATLTSSTVKLYRTSDGALVNAVLNTSGGGDAIVLTPSDLLAANTNYTFEVTAGLKDTSGNAFLPFTMSFTTGTTGGETDPSLAFEKINLSATGKKYSSVKIGPDGKLYATTIDGLIQRWTLNSNGTLGTVQNITSLQTLEGGQTFLTGIAFDPASTSTSIIIWATHSQYAFENATDWTGKISRISGANLETAVNKVVGLPRSIRDHVTNQLVFGPDGAIYFAQGSMSAMGAPDTGWGMRSEHLLSAAILRFDTSKLPSTGALNVKTESGGTYNPFASGAALTIYATGVRNAYDLVWTSDGKLYAAANGSAAGGNTPAGDGAPALTNVQQTQNDYLFLIEAGGYYGHPNPARGEYVMNGGNPTSGVDPGEVTAYPIGTMPDSNWRGFAYDFGKNWSPNGTIQYSGSAFGGSLNGRLIVARYSGGDDLLVLQLGADGKVTNTISGIAGFTHYVDPLDVAQNPTTGHLYVAEYGGERLTLVRAIAPGANITIDKPALYFNDTVATGSSPSQTITIRNTGTSALAFPADGIAITGADGARFAITSQPTMPFTIQPGQSVTVSVRFTSSTTVRIYTAKLVLKSNDPDSPTIEVDLRGLGTAGTGGQNEPSLQRILDLFQIPINVGDANPDNTNLFSNLEPLGANDEVTVQRLIKAGTGPVTIQPIAMMGVSGTPAVKFGYYRPGTPGAKTELFTIGTADAQSVNPTAIGTTSFDPGTAAFGIYSIWPWTTFKNPDNSVRETFSEDSLNRYENTTSNRRKIRFYALRNADGSIVPNAYVMAHEEFINDTSGAYDNQDIVAIIRNVQIAPSAPVVGLENRDGNGALFPDRLVFNRIDIPDSTVANVVHDVATLRINNTGNQTLSITGMSLTGPFAFVNSYTYPLTIGAGSFLDMKVRFTQTASGMGTAVNGIRNGTLTINSNDPSRRSTTVALSGHWQLQSERTPSPGSKVTEMTLADILNVYGYATSVPSQSVLTSTGNGAARLNDEVLSGYWMRAEASMPVKITQLAAFHTQGNTERIATHLQGSTTTTNVFVHAGADGQSFLPHLNGSTTALAAGTVSTAHMAGIFGFRVGNQWSDDSLNPQDTPGGGGRFLRIFVARDRSGNVIPNTYLITHDYYSTDPTTGANTSNFDFQDNIYLIENVRPANDATAPAMPSGLTASGGTGGNNLEWANNTESDLAGYNVYRSNSATGTFTKLNTSLLTSSNYLDTTASAGTTSYYRVTAVDASGNESAAATTSATRPSGDVTAPAAPTGLAFTGSLSGIALNWNDNVESDLAGYNVYRSSTSGGTYTKLNTAGLLPSSAYNDTTAPSGATSYYRVTAVDNSGNESLAATGNASRPAGDTQAPAAPAGQTATADPSGITLDWADNIEPDLAGYNVYRSASATGTFTKLNTAGLLTSSQYLDTTAPTGTSYYRITAVDSSGNESASAATSATRTALYSGVDIGGSTPAGSHTTIFEGRDYDVRGGGSNINDTLDQFYYAYRQLNGDFDMRVRLDGLTKVGDFTKAGLMARESLTSNSRNAIVYGTPGTYGDRFSYRAETGGTTGISVGDAAPVTYPNNWLRLKRVGNTFSGYKSTDGVNWTQIGPSQVINMPATVFFGMAVSARSTTKLATANFRQLGSILIDAPPAAPTGLGATGSTSGIALNWNDNTETDLAGYNVYRSSTSGGTYTKLNTSGLLTSSAYNDTTAPSGATSYYRVTAVDAAGNESAVASTNAARPVPSDTTPPAAPTGVTTSTSTASIVLDWANNTETDLAGYNLYRSATSGGTYTKLNTTGLLTASAYTDTTATAGAVSYYRITAVDTSGNESAALSTSATRPAPAVTPSGPLRINFQANGTPTVWGYAQDNGDTFATRANGWQYGWSASHTEEDRDRNVNSNQLLDTLVQMKTSANWQIAVANGTYDVKVSVGDARYATNHTINVNGTNLWTNGATAANAFLNKTVRITVTNGRIKIDNGASANTATRINYVEIIPVTRVNFQLNGSPTVAGYLPDSGDVFGSRNGRQYGWNVAHTDLDRDRNINSNQLLDTLVHFKAGANWQMAVPNGKYEVKISVGDAGYATTHTLNVNGVNYWTNAATAANAFLTKTVTITVTNGRIKLDNGAAAANATRINYLELRQIA